MTRDTVLSDTLDRLATSMIVGLRILTVPQGVRLALWDSAWNRQPAPVGRGLSLPLGGGGRYA
jgi:hypothetical protein